MNLDELVMRLLELQEAGLNTCKVVTNGYSYDISGYYDIAVDALEIEDEGERFVWIKGEPK